MTDDKLTNKLYRKSMKFIDNQEQANQCSQAKVTFCYLVISQHRLT